MKIGEGGVFPSAVSCKNFMSLRCQFWKSGWLSCADGEGRKRGKTFVCVKVYGLIFASGLGEISRRYNLQIR